MLGVRERQEGLDLKNIFGDQYSLIHLMWLYILHSSDEHALYIFTKVTKKWVLQESWSWRLHKVPGNLPSSWPQSVNINYGVDSQHSPLTILALTGIFQFCPLENHKSALSNVLFKPNKVFFLGTALLKISVTESNSPSTHMQCVSHTYIIIQRELPTLT